MGVLSLFLLIFVLGWQQALPPPTIMVEREVLLFEALIREIDPNQCEVLRGRDYDTIFKVLNAGGGNLVIVGGCPAFEVEEENGGVFVAVKNSGVVYIFRLPTSFRWKLERENTNLPPLLGEVLLKFLYNRSLTESNYPQIGIDYLTIS